jgi:hypothetical protein
MMQGNWYDHLQRTPPRRAERSALSQGFVSGIVAIVLVGGLASAWNWLSSGRLVRALGGITAIELVAEIENHPGPQGPAGLPGPRGDPGHEGAAPVITFIPQPDADYEKSGPVTGSEAYPLCTLSKIILRRNVRNPDRSCQLKQSAYRW